MPRGSPFSAIANWPIVPAAAGALAIAIFVFDSIAHLEIAVGVFYVAVVLMVVRAFGRRAVLLVSGACIALAVSRYLLAPEAPLSVTALVNLGIGVSAIAIVTYLALRNQSAERALTDQVRLIIDTIPTLAWRARPDGYVEFFNQRWQEYTSLSLDEAQGWGWTRAICSDDLAAMTDRWRAMLRTGQPAEAEARLRRADGEHRWFLFRAEPLHDERDQIVNWYGTCTDIEDHKRAERALREQAGLLDLTHDTIFVRDVQDVITYWNRGAEERYGWSREEAVGKVSHQLMQTIFPAPLEDIIAELHRTGRWEGELVHAKRDGTRVVVASRWSLRRDEQGSPLAILETNNDITERKQAEEALRASEQRYRYIFQAAGVSIWEEDFSRVKAAIDDLKSTGMRDFRQYFADHPEFVGQAIPWVKIVDVNDVTVSLFAAASKEQLLASLDSVFVPETQEVFAGELIALAEGRTSFEAETVLRTLKGERLTVLFTVRFPAQPDRFDSVLATVTDITERKRAETLTRQVMESSPDGVAVVGRDYRYHRVNPIYERNWRKPAERIVGMHVADLMGTGLFEQTIKPKLDRCFAGEEVKHTNWSVDARGRRYIAVSYSPLWLDSKMVEAALVISHDLTEHELAAEGLREAQMKLAHVNRVTTMGQLTASIAHEVNQPVAAAVTNAQAALRWLAAQPPDLDEARRALDRIVRDGKRASEVISRTRDLVRKAPPQRDSVDLNETILEVVALTRREAERHGVALQTHLAHDLPPVWGDRVQLQQVILNLLTNAIDALKGLGEGSRVLLVDSARDDADGVLVTVRDSGPGLDWDRVDDLFEAFHSTKPGGIGMGLAISRSIVEAHGGRLWATPNAPRGAVFQFTLPVEAAEASASQHTQSAS
jgi:PAS domain S-box-containing protein